MRHSDLQPFTASVRHLALVATTLLGLSATVLAAPDAGAKARGQYGFYGSSAHHSFSSARGHVDTYQRYLNETHGVPLPAAHDPVAPPRAVVTAPPAAVTVPAAVTPEAVATVDPEIAREASDAIADDIERIQRHVTRMLAQAKSRGDDAAVADLVDVDKQLAVARRGHAALHEHHASDTISPATAMDLAQKVNAALRAAHAEHDEVMKRLAKPPAP